MPKIDGQFVMDHFIAYCKLNSRSDDNSPTVPTTPGQVELAHLVATDFRQLGLTDVKYNADNGYLTVVLPANTDKTVPALGFIAHLDTADYNAEHVNPQVHPHYDGRPIQLQSGLVLDPGRFPRLKNYVGDTLITSDGTTLLGTDDKAGIAAALATAKYFVEHPEVEHGSLKFAFGPDEEIGRGAKRFDAADFATPFAYTLDNGAPGELQNETFNAASADIDIQGVAVHPGEAYGLMVNALTLANQLIAQLPADEVPEKSRDHDGFFLVTEMSGTIDHASLNIIIRDFDNDKYQAKLALLKRLVASLNTQGQVQMTLTEQYLNIKPALNSHPEAVELATQAYRELGMVPRLLSFRGGTDGNFITAKGIPTPNLFNGGGNYHGPYEYESVGDLVKLTQTLIQISTDYYQKN